MKAVKLTNVCPVLISEDVKRTIEKFELPYGERVVETSMVYSLPKDQQ